VPHCRHVRSKSPPGVAAITRSKKLGPDELPGMFGAPFHYVFEYTNTCNKQMKASDKGLSTAC
jgi:hypothetical protein